MQFKSPGKNPSNSMDSFYLDTEILWSSDEPFPEVPSAFVPYTKSITDQPFNKLANSSKRQNVNKRMIEFLRTLPRCYDTSHEHLQFENEVKERNYRHMINERLRRNKQKQSYAALHSMLPPGTKIDKNSVLQIATLHLKELKGLKVELQKQNNKLEKDLLHVNEETTTVHLRWQYPSSGIDSMIGVLTCLKDMGLKARTIQSEFSVGEFYAVLEIQPKVEAVVVEKAIQIALADLEWRLGR